MPDTVYFHADVSNTNTVQWFFGDGSTATGIDVMHIYMHSAYYPVQAIATGDGGQTSRFKNVNVSPYTKLRITLAATTVPQTKPDGTFWDNDGTSPDLRVIIYNDANTQIMNDHFVALNALSAAFNYPSPALVTDFEKIFTVRVYDYDDPSYDDYIGEMSFRPADYMTDTTALFPSHIPKTNNAGLSIGLNISWGQ